MTTTQTVGTAPNAGAVADDPTAATPPAPTDVPLRIAGELAERLAGTSRWQQ
jgi:hypothetical protein